MSFSARLIAARAHPCPYCGAVMKGQRVTHANHPTREHVVPRALGGGPTIIVCRRCNNHKGDMTLDEWADALALAHDYRAKRVAALACGLREGTIMIVTDGDGTHEANPVALAAGIFA